ncbi:hypothetical protein KCP70_21310 [Salmonella enterica subsp. enterica]|nr:hypothetical protein KCP70_21310 [Salmonella enterica subsp. enterica]
MIKRFVRARKAFDLRRCVKQVNHAFARSARKGRLLLFSPFYRRLAMVTILPLHSSTYLRA